MYGQYTHSKVKFIRGEGAQVEQMPGHIFKHWHGFETRPIGHLDNSPASLSSDYGTFMQTHDSETVGNDLLYTFWTIGGIKAGHSLELCATLFR